MSMPHLRSWPKATIFFKRIANLEAEKHHSTYSNDWECFVLPQLRPPEIVHQLPWSSRLSNHHPRHVDIGTANLAMAEGHVLHPDP